MAKFRFRFETLWKLRAAARDERREELAKALKAERILDEQREQLSAEVRQTRDQSLQAAAPGPVNIDRLLQSSRHALILQAQLAQLRQQQARVTEEVERRRRALMEADRQVKVLDKLRERQQREHQQKLDELEQKELDDLGQQRHSHHRGSLT